MFTRLFKKLYLPKSSDQIWTTREGQKIKVSDLKDDHLLNIQNFLSDRILMYAIISKEVKQRKLKPKLSKIRKIPGQASLDQWEQDMLAELNTQDMF